MTTLQGGAEYKKTLFSSFIFYIQCEKLCNISINTYLSKKFLSLPQSLQRNDLERLNVSETQRLLDWHNARRPMFHFYASLWVAYQPPLLAVDFCQSLYHILNEWSNQRFCFIFYSVYLTLRNVKSKTLKFSVLLLSCRWWWCEKSINSINYIPSIAIDVSVTWSVCPSFCTGRCVCLH